MKKLIIVLLILGPLLYSIKTLGQNSNKELFVTGTITSVNIKGDG